VVKATPSLPPAVAVKILRQRYPAALVCTVCAVLLATVAASYAGAQLTEVQRLAYVCAECRLEAAEASRVAAVRAEVGRRNLVAARAAKDAARGNPRGSTQTPESAPTVARTCGRIFRRSPGRRIAGHQFGPGRPCVSPAEQRRKARERDRAYRLRKKEGAQA
jgi:hypothetical protein